MKRTFTAIVCTLLLVAVLAGCGSTNPFDAAAKTFSDEGMTITLTSDFSKQSMDGYTVCATPARATTSTAARRSSMTSTTRIRTSSTATSP